MMSKKYSPCLQIAFESENFPSVRQMANSGQLRLTWDDLIWAAVTLGRPNLHYVFKFGLASVYEAIFRCSLIRMSLQRHNISVTRISRTNAFNSLDPTEKGAINYFLGMVVCKVFADQFLDTPWLLHLDVFREQLAPGILTGRSRPDLVGQDTSGLWHAFECKGRSNIPGEYEKSRAKSQAQRLVSVDGQNCDLQIGAITYFRNDILHFYWRDPEPVDPKRLNPINLVLSDTAWRDHYESFMELILPRWDNRAATDGGIQLVRIEEADIEIGAHPELLSQLIERNWRGARQLSIELRESLVELGYRKDGLIVKSGRSWHRPQE